ncbi:hypothetical protein [Enterococcus durans]|uniref:Uncharacterized protein n=1 Tax=Enterococcus durans TaxID=53345 RepID=A0A377KQ60_9ENTE|nr:hypothetical protein [Enterococcus durans]STP30511.1 Uncharacterised protein [Enterococcus durans]
MLNFYELLTKYEDSFIYVDERKKIMDVLKQIVDIEEKPIDFFLKKRIELLTINVVNSIYYNPTRNVSIKLFNVINNEKSKKYYQQASKFNNRTDSLFEDEQIYVFIDKSVGIVETNSLLLSSDVRILSGITYENVAKKDIYFMDYVSAFEQRNELKQ